jgi:hypothetical protein
MNQRMPRLKRDLTADYAAYRQSRRSQNSDVLRSRGVGVDDVETLNGNAPSKTADGAGSERHYFQMFSRRARRERALFGARDELAMAARSQSARQSKQCILATAEVLARIDMGYLETGQ